MWSKPPASKCLAGQLWGDAEVKGKTDQWNIMVVNGIACTRRNAKTVFFFLRSENDN